MNIQYRNDKTIYVDNARIIFRNFSGKPDRFNPAGGKRTFHLVVPDVETADKLIAAGWAVRKKPAEDGGMFCSMKVNVHYGKGRAPFIALYANARPVRINEDTVGTLDGVSIDHVNMILRPYAWDPSGRNGASAYLNSLEVYVRVDEIEARFASEEHPVDDEDLPF